jgi:hypothetical protein
MTVTRDELLQDLAYARTLAEEGRQTPLVGGSYLVLFGVLLAICYTAQYFILTSDALPRGLAGLIWMGFGVAAMIGVFLLRGRTKSMPGNASVGNRAERAVWNGAAIAILAVVAGVVLRGVFTENFAATDAIMAAGFGLYGVALFATAELSGYMWLKRCAWLSWAISGTLWYFMGEPWAYIMAAIGAVLVLLVPGVIMMRREPSAVV